MKKLINRKLYNTETSEHVCTYSNGFGSNDFNYLWIELHRTKKGSWFKLIDAGANTQYSVPNGNMRTGVNDHIVPINADEAYQFIEKHGTIEDALMYFPDSFEDA